MPESSQAPGQPLAYAYEHSQTEATTGYFSCLPVPGPDFAEALALLERSPLDSYLHQYVLRQLCGMDAPAWKALAGQCLAGESPVLACLLLECALLAEACAKAIEPLRQSLADLALPAATPMPLLIQAARADLSAHGLWSGIFAANIHGHKSLPLGEAARLAPIYDCDELAASMEKMRRCAGMLAKERAHWPLVEAGGRPEPKETYQKAVEALARAELLAGPEMRHEASLSPIALLRQWRLGVEVSNGRVRHTLAGQATAYGRGLSLAAARASYAMEIVERACAHASVEQGGAWGNGRALLGGNAISLRLASIAQLRCEGAAFHVPAASLTGLEDMPVHWLAAEDSGGRAVFVPCQAVFLFSNLDEPLLFDGNGSTGLASGNSMAEARLAALTEIVERDAHATTPFTPDGCFQLASREPRVRGLLEDYRARGIIVQFQDITTEIGMPAFRCFVTGRDGSIAQATGAGLNGARAAIAALTETPWPYVWARPAPYGQPSGPGLSNLPWRFLEDLPDFSLPSASASLELLETVLEKQGATPLYVDISRADLGFPVVRAFVPGLSADADFSATSPPSPRLMARARLMGAFAFL